jgi:iron(III) transport system permease protein
MDTPIPAASSARFHASPRLPPALTRRFVMACVLVTLGLLLVYPIFLLLVNSFNVAGDFFGPTRQWGVANWALAFRQPALLRSLGNTVLIWSLVLVISFPTAVAISWLLARTRIPWGHALEFMFWVSFMMPGTAVTISWIMLMDPDTGMLNELAKHIPFIGPGLFNVYSIPGIVFVHLMANGISVKVMLLTPAFRNMDAALEEAARVSGETTLRTMIRVTLPLMAVPMTVVFALQLLRMFQSFEIEFLLGVPFHFFVYSTMIFDLVHENMPPLYGQATVLASLTLLIVALIIPVQRRIINRRNYTTISGRTKPGLIDLGRWKYVAFGAIALLLAALTVLPECVLALCTFMTRVGFFGLHPVFTLSHWQAVLSDDAFLGALRTTLVVALSAAIGTPLLFSMVAYIIVRTRWPGRGLLDTIIWASGAIPGMLTGLGLLQVFLGTPGLSFLYGSIWALILVLVLQGNTLTTNIAKGAIVQVGQEMEEAARVGGAGWLFTYRKVWLPLMMPTLVRLGVFNFIIAANATSQIILLASRNTMTLSIMALQLMDPQFEQREAASIVSLIIILLTVGVAFVGQIVGRRYGMDRATMVDPL